MTLLAFIGGFLFGGAAGGYIGYRWGSNIVKDGVQVAAHLKKLQEKK